MGAGTGARGMSGHDPQGHHAAAARYGHRWRQLDGRARVRRLGIDLSGRDLSVKPGDDFYRYANGAWDDKTVIPPDRTSFGNFAILAMLSENRTRALIEAAAAGCSNDPDAAKIGAAYNAFMDEARINALDAKPLAADLAAIGAATTHEALAVLMAQGPHSFQPAIFDLDIGADKKDPAATPSIWEPAASACQTATTISTPRWRIRRLSIRSISPAC